MSIGKKDFLSKFALSETKVHLDSIDADVVIRNFTAEENDDFTKFMIKGLDKKGDPIVDLEKSMQIKYKKIAAALVDPKVSEKDIQGMHGAKDFIEEIIGHIDGKDPEKFDEEGNED